MDERREAYRRSVSRIGGRASVGVERLRVCRGIDFKRLIRSDFSVFSGSLRPGSPSLIEIYQSDGGTRKLTFDVFTIRLFSVFV